MIEESMNENTNIVVSEKKLETKYTQQNLYVALNTILDTLKILNKFFEKKFYDEPKSISDAMVQIEKIFLKKSYKFKAAENIIKKELLKLNNLSKTQREQHILPYNKRYELVSMLRTSLKDWLMDDMYFPTKNNGDQYVGNISEFKNDDDESINNNITDQDKSKIDDINKFIKEVFLNKQLNTVSKKTNEIKKQFNIAFQSFDTSPSRSSDENLIDITEAIKKLKPKDNSHLDEKAHEFKSLGAYSIKNGLYFDESPIAKAYAKFYLNSLFNDPIFHDWWCYSYVPKRRFSMTLDFIKTGIAVRKGQPQGYPTLTFTPFRIGERQQVQCIVSVSGHSTNPPTSQSIKPDDILGDFIGNTASMLAWLTLFNKTEHINANKYNYEFLFLDYESHNFSSLIKSLTKIPAIDAYRACAEKKAMSYLLKLLSKGINLKIEGNIAIHFYPYPIPALAIGQFPNSNDSLLKNLSKLIQDITSIQYSHSSDEEKNEYKKYKKKKKIHLIKKPVEVTKNKYNYKIIPACVNCKANKRAIMYTLNFAKQQQLSTVTPSRKGSSMVKPLVLLSTARLHHRNINLSDKKDPEFNRNIPRAKKDPQLFISPPRIKRVKSTEHDDDEIKEEDKLNDVDGKDHKKPSSPFAGF